MLVCMSAVGFNMNCWSIQSSTMMCILLTGNFGKFGCQGQGHATALLVGNLILGTIYGPWVGVERYVFVSKTTFYFMFWLRLCQP